MIAIGNINKHCAHVHKNCTCEYCCSVRDEEDDEQMEQEYKTAMYCGQEMFDTLQVGDSVQYYNIPYEDRNIVYIRNLNIIKEYARAIMQGTVITKTEHYIEIEINRHKQKASPAECWCWGLHKLDRHT